LNGQYHAFVTDRKIQIEEFFDSNSPDEAGAVNRKIQIQEFFDSSSPNVLAARSWLG
jgi:hypothetical protein